MQLINNKNRQILLLFVLTAASFLKVLAIADHIRYDASWKSLDSRPLPSWYDESKVGIFLHWGLFSVPSYGNEWFWSHWINDNATQFVDFIEKNYPKGFSYQEFANEFKAEFFNPDDWAELFEKSGAKYVVLTSKHHEGYTLWPSKYSYSYNAKDVGPHRDLVGELAQAVRAKNLTFGLYHSLFEWFNPMYLSDKESGHKNREYVDYKVLPEMYELVNAYQPDILWSDGDDKAPVAYWNSLEFIAWLYNDSPVRDTIVVNDRWGHATHCEHGGYYTCKDRYNPGYLIEHKWENAMTLDKNSWSYRRNAKASEYFTIHELLVMLARTVSCNGNILINVGPTKEGIIDPILQERLTQLGEWLTINGEAVYKSKPWSHQKDANTDEVWYTMREKYVYAIVLSWPKNNVLKIKSALNLFNSTETSIGMLGNEGNLTWTISNDTLEVTFLDKSKVASKNAWVLKISP